MSSSHELKRRFRGIERQEKIDKIRRTAAESEYRRYTDQREKAARHVLDNVRSPELAGVALGICLTQFTAQ